MNAVTKHINDVLQEGILKAYKAGIKDILKKNRKVTLRVGKEPAFDAFREDDKFKTKPKAKTKPKPKPNAFYDIDYTAEDLKAIYNFRVEAFTVATIGDFELQEKLKDLAEKVIREKQGDLDYFKSEAMRISDRYIRGDWLQTNLTTATSSAYRAAEWIRLQDPAVKDTYPAYQYKTRNDSRVRDEHRAIADKIFRNHDPILKSIYPPNGWNCRCFVIPLSQEELNGVEIENEFRSQEETKKLLKEVFTNPKDEVNFMRNAGETKSIWKKWINEKLSGFDGNMKELIKAKVREYGAGIVSQPIPVVASSTKVTDGLMLEKYTPEQIANARARFNRDMTYKTADDFYQEGNMSPREAERRAEDHNATVRKIANGDIELKRKWKLWYLNDEAKKSQKAAESKAKIIANKTASSGVLAEIKSAGKNLTDYYKWLNKPSNIYRKEFFNKKYTAESARAFINSTN